MPTIDGVRWDRPEALEAVRGVTELDAELVFYDGEGPQRFDVLPISVATDGGVAAVGVDRRRFRANIYLEGTVGLDVPSVSEARLSAFAGARPLCNDDVRPGDAGTGVLQRIYWELDGRTALDCHVLEPGPVRVGDDAELLEFWTLPRRAAS